MADKPLRYRPIEEDMIRAVKEARLDLIKQKADAKSKILPKGKREAQRKLDKDIADMTNEERNDYIAAYNTGKIESDVPRTQKMIRVMIFQSDSIKRRAQKASELIRKDLPTISTENAPPTLAGDMGLIFGDVDTNKITPSQMQCVARILNMGAKLEEEPHEPSPLGSDIMDPNSPINVPGIPKNEKEFQEEFKDENVFGKWGEDPFFFLKLLLKMVFDIFAFLIRVAICPIFLGFLPVGFLIAEGLFAILNIFLKLDGDDAYHCIKFRKKEEECPSVGKEEAMKHFNITEEMWEDDQERDADEQLYSRICDPESEDDMWAYINSKIEEYKMLIQRGGDPFATGKPKDNIPPPICASEDRAPTPQEVMAASNTMNYATREVKESPDAKMKDYFALMATTSAEEESVTLKGSLINADSRIGMVRTTQNHGPFATSKLGEIALDKMQKMKFSDKIVQYLAMTTEMLRNIDNMVTGAVELKFLSYRLRDTICCFIRILYAIFIADDDRKTVGQKEGKSMQQLMSEWNAELKEGTSNVNKFIKKLQIVATLLDTLLATLTTTVSTNWEVKLGDFSLAGLGKFLVAQIRKAVFEALATLNELLFDQLRKLIFGIINQALDADEDFRNALKECDLFNILLNWLQCLLNWLENLIMNLLSKIRGDQDYAWGQIQINLDFTFGNKQVTLLRDLLRLIGKFALQIVQLCNVNNIRDDDAFVELVDTVSNELGVESYILKDEEYRYVLDKDIVNSVMNPRFDHTGIEDNLATFAQKDKDNFGFSVKENIIVDRGAKPFDNIIKEPVPAPDAGVEKAAYDQDKALKEAQKDTVLPDTMNVSKEEFVIRCGKCYKNVGNMMRNNKTLRELFKNYDLDIFSM